MVLRYEKEKICLAITIDSEDMLNSIKMLVEKGKILCNFDDGIKVKIEGELYIDFNNDELRVSF